MTFKKFVDNIENIYADQGDKPESERLRYGQIIMNELWNVWPKKYHEIMGSDKDPFYCEIVHKKPYDLLSELEKEWPVFPDKTDAKNYSIPSSEQIRIQRLEKKIKKLQNSNKRHRKNLEFYKRIVRDFPWIEPSVKTTQENIELKKTLKEKNWIIRGLQEELNTVRLITDHDIECLQALSLDLEKFSVNDHSVVSAPHLLNRLLCVLKSMKNKFARYGEL